MDKAIQLSAREKALRLKEKSDLGELSQEVKNKLPDTEKLINSDKYVRINTAIHTASVAAATVGAIPIPISDALILVRIQLKMLESIYKAYGMNFSDGTIVNFIRLTLIPYIGKSLVNLIPGGSIVNASVAIAITESIGWSAAISLENGEDITKDTEKFEKLVIDSLKKLINKENK